MVLSVKKSEKNPARTGQESDWGWIFHIQLCQDTDPVGLGRSLVFQKSFLTVYYSLFHVIRLNNGDTIYGITKKNESQQTHTLFSDLFFMNQTDRQIGGVKNGGSTTA